MATATTSLHTDWRQEWFEIEDATYLNFASQAPMPRATIRAVQAAIEANKYPHHKSDSTFFEVPNRIRASIAKLIGGKPEEIAITTGASNGMAAVAYGLSWNPGDEVITSKGEFPLQYATWKPMEEREGLKLKIVSPREHFITADDLLAAMTPKTRAVSVSLVRFDDGSLLDAARVAAACRAQGALLVLDISQSCGAMPLDVEKLGADFMVCAGYKWLLGPLGQDFSGPRASSSPKCGLVPSTGWRSLVHTISPRSPSTTRNPRRPLNAGTPRSRPVISILIWWPWTCRLTLSCVWVRRRLPRTTAN